MIKNENRTNISSLWSAFEKSGRLDAYITYKIEKARAEAISGANEISKEQR